MDPVVHFEVPAEDRKRMSEFYAKVFGWQTKQLGEDYGNYVTAMTTEKEKTPGAISGGFYDKMDDPKMNHPSVVIAVKDINESIQKIKDAGGTIHGEPMEIPKVGMFVAFTDTEGNRLSILQPSPEMNNT
jgi:uncharacterized protein